MGRNRNKEWGITTLAKNHGSLNRRNLLQAAGALAVAGLSGQRLAHAQATRPNIVYIVADDLGYADLSCYGRREYKTPNIDRLAAEGVKFMQGYANSAVCSATRVGLITGRYQYRLPAGLEEPIGPMSPKQAGLPPDHPTLPSILKKAGYGTTLVGKWHLGSLPDYSPLKSGYDHFFGVWGGYADYFNHGHTSTSSLYEQEVKIERVGYMTNLLGGRTIQAIENYARSRQPFFISVHFTAPHWPWEGPDDAEEAARIKSAFHYDGGSQKTYAEMVQNLDMNVGRILKALEEQGLANNTIVIFTSDNGGERFSDIWPFTGMKGELLEGGLRVPYLVRWPGQIPAGTTSEQVLITMDLVPTLLAAAGLAPDSAYPSDGENLLPVMTGRQPVRPRKLFWRFAGAGQRAVRDGNLKYLRIADNEFLFDVVADPRERGNLKDHRKDDFERLKSEWETWNMAMLPDRLPADKYLNTADAYADHYKVPGKMNFRPLRLPPK